MIIYHGSENIIDKPVFGKGKKYNDYGRGFYCTEDMELAKEWAVDENRDGYANRYELDLTGMNIINLGSDNFCVLHWITTLLMNRIFELTTPLAREGYRYLIDNYSVNTDNADIIKGYRADDSYFSYAQDFVNGSISVSQLTTALKLGNLGEQIMIRSRKAFDAVKYTGNESVAASEWYVKKIDRERRARKQYSDMDKAGYIRGDLYMIRIIDEEVKADDPRLR